MPYMTRLRFHTGEASWSEVSWLVPFALENFSLMANLASTCSFQGPGMLRVRHVTTWSQETDLPRGLKGRERFCSRRLGSLVKAPAALQAA
jgi:hypothetical protein